MLSSESEQNGGTKNVSILLIIYDKNKAFGFPNIYGKSFV